jgi:hypothetical protein
VTDDAAGLCIQHGTPPHCITCAEDHESYLRFLRGQSQIAGLLAERVAAADRAVGVLGRYIAFEVADDKWDIGATDLADAYAAAQTSAAALRGVRRIADLYAAKVAGDLAAAEREG